MEEYIFNTFLKVLYYHNSEKKHRAIRDCRQTSAVNRCINIANYRCSLMLEPRQAKARCLTTRMIHAPQRFVPERLSKDGEIPNIGRNSNIHGRRSVGTGGTALPPPHFVVHKNCEAYSLTQHVSLLEAAT